MNMAKFAALFSLTLFVSGCGVIKTTTTSYHSNAFKMSGTIAVVPAKSESGNSLEAAHYKQQFENRLASVGYQVTSDIRGADLIAIFAYGIDEGREVLVSTPLYGQTGSGTTYSHGTVQTYNGSAAYSATSYSAPSYGVVGAATSSETLYTRIIALDIVDPSTRAEGSMRKLYEARSRSTGACASIASVFREMLDGMFSEFPGVNGKSRSKTVMRGGLGC